MPHLFFPPLASARRVARLASAKLAKASASASATWERTFNGLFQWENHRNQWVILQITRRLSCRLGDFADFADFEIRKSPKSGVNHEQK